MSEIKTSLEPIFMIIGQGVRDLSFENKIDLGTVSDEQPEIDIDIQVDGQRKESNVYEVTLMVRAEAKQNTKTLFILELQYMGVCQIENIIEENISPLLMIQVPTLLFPYARQIISEITSSSGFPPLLLQPVDFANLYAQQNSQNFAVAGRA